MNRICKRNRNRWLSRSVQVAVLSVLLATGITWAGSIYDHPIDQAIVAGMAAPDCADVRAMSAGSLLLATQPQSDICRSFFLYRGASPDAADNIRSYRAFITQDRFWEFRQLIGYVWLLCLPLIAIAFTLVSVAGTAYSRYRDSGPRQGN